MTCQTCHGANQGRGCPDCLNATRRVVGLEPLGGGTLFPMEEDEPIGNPEDDGLFAVCLTVALVFVTVVSVGAVFLYAYRNFYPA